MNNDVINFLDDLKKDCFVCELWKRHKNNSKCNNCPFVVMDDEFTCRSKYKSIYGIRRPHLFYFVHHLELNWELPKLPDIDSSGNSRYDYKLWRWEVNHKNKNHDDNRKDNLELLTNVQHTQYHVKHKHLYMQNDENKKKHGKIVSDKISSLIKNGRHHFVTNPPARYSEYRQYNYNKILDYINSNLDKEYVIIDKIKRLELGYNGWQKLQRGLDVLKKRHNLPINIIIINSGRNKTYIDSIKIVYVQK